MNESSRGHHDLDNRSGLLPDGGLKRGSVPDTSLVLVHYVVGEIFLWHMSHKPVSGQCDKRMLLGALCPVELRRGGLSWSQVCRTLNVGNGSTQRSVARLGALDQRDDVTDHRLGAGVVETSEIT